MFAAVDAHYEGETVAIACVTFHAWNDPVAASEHTTLLHGAEAYTPGEFWRRELPGILAVLRLLPVVPETVLIDGYVWLDGEGRKGLGAHLFDALGGSTAVVGVAKHAFHGAVDAALVSRGASARPLYVTAQGMPLEQAVAAVQAMHGAHRVPVLLKRADRLCRAALTTSTRSAGGARPLGAMAKTPNLLNDDGTASMATMFMMSHHAFRRDLARFAVALEAVARGDTSRVEALKSEWQNYRGALHGHHQMEDGHVFPQLAADHESLRATIARLVADHQRIDPLLERGDRAFAELPETKAAAAVVAELKALLDPHLATEEAEVVPLLRGAKEFPSPATDAEAELYAGGFAWSLHGIAPAVVDQALAMLPRALTDRLPAAREAFASRCERVWGSAGAGAATTPIPDGY